jgi:hypothetical protein
MAGKKILFIILVPVIILLMATIGYFYYQLTKTQVVFPDSNLAKPTVDENWNTYQNKAFDYQINVPVKYGYDQIGNPGPAAIDSGNSICISLSGVCKIIINGYTNTNKTEVKTWIKQNLNQVNVNQLQKATFNGLPAYYLKNQTLESYFLAYKTDVIWIQIIGNNAELSQTLSTFNFTK